MASLVCPRGLEKRSRELWKQIVKDHPHLSTADAPFLTVYVKLFAQYEAAVDKVTSTGALVVSSGGNLKLAPAMAVIESLTNRLIRMARELGLTVASRPKIGKGGKIIIPEATRARAPRKHDAGASGFRVTG